MNSRTAAFPDEPVVDDGAEFVPASSRFSVDGVMQSIRNFATLSEALRILGAGVILASMSVFMLQGWSEGNDIRRYLLLLTQTGLLGAAGFAMSHLLKETKGARIFFGLALVSITANFTILGALLYSVFQWDGGLTTYPGYAEWQIGNAASVGATLGGAMVVLVPITMFCFAIMARHSAKPLSLHFLLLNALLLLPIRDSIYAGTVALIGIFYALAVARRLTQGNPALRTGEGKFALATLFLPLGIILFRSMYFYEVDSLMVAMVSMSLFLMARQASQFPERNPRFATFLESLSVPLALIVAFAVTDFVDPMVSTGLEAPVFSVIYAALGIDVLRRTSSRFLAKMTGATVSLFVGLSFTFSVANHPDALTALLSLVAGAVLLFWGIADKKAVAMFAGISTLLSAVVFGSDEIVQFVLRSSWIELAIFGASAIALGSVLDRHGVMLKLRITQWINSASRPKDRIALDG